MREEPMPYFFKLNDDRLDEPIVYLDEMNEQFVEDVEESEDVDMTIISVGVSDLDVDDSYDEHVVVPKALVYRAISCMSYDSKRAYKANDTKYADRRHGTARGLAGYVERKFVDFPETSTYFPEELWEDLGEIGAE